MIKRMTSPSLISPRQLAEAIGASESSLKRWADDGLLRVSKTAGGHRRIRVTEAIRFIRARKIELVQPDAIGLSPSLVHTNESLKGTNSAEQFTELLLSDEPERAETYLEGLYLAGDSVAKLGDEVIKGSLETIGVLWKHRNDGILLEHRATDTCLRALIRIRMLFEPEPSAPRAIGGAIPQDPYLLPPMLASIVAAESGLRATNLGPNNPFPTIRHAIDENQVPLLWIATSLVKEPEETSEAILALANHVSEWGGMVAVGGREAGLLELNSSPSLTMCNSMSEFEKLARSIAQADSA